MRLFSWLLDCRASLAMTGSVQRRPLPVIARRSCAAAIQSFSVRRPEEAAFDQCFGHPFLFRSSCDAAIQLLLGGLLDCFASLAMRGEDGADPSPSLLGNLAYRQSSLPAWRRTTSWSPSPD